MGSSRNSPRPDHKHDIRRAFQGQLRTLWAKHPFLREAKHGYYVNAPNISPDVPMWQGLAARHGLGSYHFVPLVREELALTCSLDILFLRPDLPGNLIKSADIDSRLKTLFDALKMPKDIDQLGTTEPPGADEDPFYCLLEDDGLISHVSVATDLLLQPTHMAHSKNALTNDARLVIKVDIRPYNLTFGNINFG